MKLEDVNQQIQINRFTLNFTKNQKQHEDDFRNDYFENNLKHFRLCIIYSIIFYGGMTLLDFLVFREHFMFISSIRFLIVIPIFIIGYFFTYNPNYKYLWRFTNNLFIVVTSGGFIAMMAYCPPPMNYSFYAGIIVSLMFGYTFIRSYFKDTIVVGAIVFGLYFFVSVKIGTPFEILCNNGAYVFVTNILGMIICYSIELAARREFYLRRELKIEKDIVIRVNSDLENQVDKRTKELSEKTEALEKEKLEHDKSEQEKRELENRLLQAHKMESIGTLAGGIAHDFNNILSSILGFTELAIGEVQKGTVLENDLQEIYAGGKRAKELVARILTFARQSDEQPKPIKIHSIADEFITFIRSTIPSTIEIQTNLESDSLILGNQTQLHQIMMNLFTNAAHSIEPDGGTIELNVKDVSIEESTGLKSVGLTPGKYVEMTVTDTGSGISSDIIGQVFDPYFTTKKIGEGTGMGLSMVHGIVESYNGKINVQSQPGTGSTVRLYFPVIEGQVDQKPYVSEKLPTGTEHILFVDDEESIAKMGSQMLTRLGYTVTSRTSSLEALGLFRKTPDSFDLVITDMTMPDMTGDTLALEIKNIRPDIPIILCTGYNKKLYESSALDNAVEVLIHKPVVQSKLVKMIRSILDER